MLVNFRVEFFRLEIKRISHLTFIDIVHNQLRTNKIDACDYTLHNA